MKCIALICIVFTLKVLRRNKIDGSIHISLKENSIFSLDYVR